MVRRYQAGAPGSRYNPRSSEPSWVQVDLLTLRLSYFDQKEEYKLILHNNSPTTQDYKSVGGPLPRASSAACCAISSSLARTRALSGTAGRACAINW